MRIAYALLTCSLALLLIPGDAFTQFPPGGRMRGGGPRWGGQPPDPGQQFDNLANGKKEIVIAEETNPWRQRMLTRVAESAGVTNGRLTREQYIAGSQKLMAQWQGGGGWNRGGAPANPPANTGGAADGDVAKMAEAEFKRLDRNGDGLLNQDEMDQDLKAQWQQWDTNKDGSIDLTEFKAYYAAKMNQRQNQRGPEALIITTPPEQEDPKPPVYRAGKLPQGIPSWFQQLDTDGDGQIGLYEWKASGRPIEEFLAMDRNKDGFLTIAEVMRAQPAGRGQRATGNTVASRNPASRSQRPQGGNPASGFQPPGPPNRVQRSQSQ
jgi:Ca2+-binding EF-hand superfamily protein